MPRKPIIEPRPVPRATHVLVHECETIELHGVVSNVAIKVAYLENVDTEAKVMHPELHITGLCVSDELFSFLGEDGRNQPAVFSCGEHRAIRALAELLTTLADRVEMKHFDGRA